jgi:hypothetical protein
MSSSAGMGSSAGTSSPAEVGDPLMELLQSFEQWEHCSNLFADLSGAVERWDPVLCWWRSDEEDDLEQWYAAKVTEVNSKDGTVEVVFYDEFRKAASYTKAQKYPEYRLYQAKPQQSKRLAYWYITWEHVKLVMQSRRLHPRPGSRYCKVAFDRPLTIAEFWWVLCFARMRAEKEHENPKLPLEKWKGVVGKEKSGKKVVQLQHAQSSAAMGSAAAKVDNGPDFGGMANIERQYGETGPLLFAKMLKAANFRSGDSFADLGSGLNQLVLQIQATCGEEESDGEEESGAEATDASSKYLQTAVRGCQIPYAVGFEACGERHDAAVILKDHFEGLFEELRLNLRWSYIPVCQKGDFNDQTLAVEGNWLWQEKADVVYLCNFGQWYTGQRGQGLTQSQDNPAERTNKMLDLMETGKRVVCLEALPGFQARSAKFTFSKCQCSWHKCKRSVESSQDCTACDKKEFLVYEVGDAPDDCEESGYRRRSTRCRTDTSTTSAVGKRRASDASASSTGTSARGEKKARRIADRKPEGAGTAGSPVLL